MDDIEAAISCAWYEIAPKLLADPEELKRRLARRKDKCFVRPMHAWCVALRASDHRITPMDVAIVPAHAVSLDAESHPGRYAEHEVTLTKDLLLRLCQPVEIGRPGEPADEVAKRLGCHPKDLLRLRRNGTLRTTPKPGLRGRHGPPVPLIYTPEYLNPQAYGRTVPHEAFASCWLNMPERIVEGFTQTLTRVPRCHRILGRDKFSGWHWICPCCRKRANILFHPVDQPDYPTWIGFAPALAEPLPKPVSIFACSTCHGVMSFDRVHVGAGWNHLVKRYSGGLLYGHEVAMPDWIKADPSRARGPLAESPRRLQLKRLLVTTTLTCKEIGQRLRMPETCVAKMAERIYRREGVRSRRELRDRLADSYPQPQPSRAAG